MKKEYLKPKTITVECKLSGMIAASLDYGGENNGAAEAEARRNNVLDWSEE